jgi:cytochrome c556
MIRVRLSLAALAVTATALPLLAQDATNPAVIARQELMKGIGADLQVIGRMAQGQAPFDAAAAEAARADLVARSAQTVALFEPEETDPASEALPEIWLAFDDFTQKAGALETAANALDVSSLETLQAGLGAVGGTCRACHTSYRAAN